MLTAAVKQVSHCTVILDPFSDFRRKILLNFQHWKAFLSDKIKNNAQNLSAYFQMKEACLDVETGPRHPTRDGVALKFALKQLCWPVLSRNMHSEKHGEKMQSNRINVSCCVFGFGFSLVCYVYSSRFICFEPHYLLVVCTRDPQLGQCVDPHVLRLLPGLRSFHVRFLPSRLTRFRAVLLWIM